MPKSVFGRGSASGSGPFGRAHDAPPDPLIGWGGNTPPILHPTRHRPTFGDHHASPRIPARSTPILATLNHNIGNAEITHCNAKLQLYTGQTTYQ